MFGRENASLILWLDMIDFLEHNLILLINRMDTPPKINIDPENDTFQKGSPCLRGHFQVPC